MENKEPKENVNIDKKEVGPDKSKAYPVRNFFKELKRVSWPTNKKNYKYFFLVFAFIIFLLVFFALISWGATELFKVMGVI